MPPLPELVRFRPWIVLILVFGLVGAGVLLPTVGSGLLPRRGDEAGGKVLADAAPPNLVGATHRVLKPRGEGEIYKLGAKITDEPVEVLVNLVQDPVGEKHPSVFSTTRRLPHVHGRARD